MNEQEKKPRPRRRSTEVGAGMLVGLGTGSTAAYAIERRSAKVRAGLAITRGRHLAGEPSAGARGRHRDRSISRDVAAVDLTIDGVDEIDDRLPRDQGRGRGDAAREDRRQPRRGGWSSSPTDRSASRRSARRRCRSRCCPSRAPSSPRGSTRWARRRSLRGGRRAIAPIRAIWSSTAVSRALADPAAARRRDSHAIPGVARPRPVPRRGRRRLYRAPTGSLRGWNAARLSG